MWPFTSTKDDDTCNNHHFPEEWEEKERFQIYGPGDINPHTRRHEDDWCDVRIYRQVTKTCLHENCRKTKSEHKEIFRMNIGDFVELMELFKDE